MQKRKLPQELAWLLGILIVTLGVRLVAKSSLGVSMVVAPAYILSQKLGISFGVAEYLFQGLLFLLVCLLTRSFQVSDLFTVVTVLFYGAVLDGWTWLLRDWAPAGLPARVLALVLGAALTALGIAFMFRAYLSPQAYELFVKSISKKIGMPMEKFKMLYDVSSLALSVLLALILFGGFRSGGDWLIGVGTVYCTLSNSLLITLSGKLLDRFFRFDAAFPGLERRFR